jgi:glycosyltransferase involved in cell wall biosynthesis
VNLLLVMDPFIRVPPDYYGGIERVIADVANALARRGHQITLWAGPGSAVQGSVEPFGRESEWSRWSNVRNTATLAVRFLRRRGCFDLVHNFGRLAYLAPIMSRDLPKVQTYMRTVNPSNMRTAKRLGAHRLHYTAVSTAIRDTGSPGGGDWSVIYNCAVPARYAFSASVDAASAPLVFLGRLDRCKGIHHAITVAERLRRPLVIAGTISSLAHDQRYFVEELKPRIDGDLIKYVGPVNDVEKQRLLGSAAAMLLPIEWEEPFPVVLPESMLCGTPLIAFRRGGVPEGIEPGQTGFLCDTVDEMTALVARLPELDRHVVRREAERRFSDEAIVDDYERLYARMCARPAASA